MREELQSLMDQFRREAAGVDTLESWSSLRDRYFAKEKGLLSLQLRRVKEIPPPERPAFGQDVNRLKQSMETELAALGESVQEKALAEKIQRERVDITLPGYLAPQGTLHPVRQVESQICDIFMRMGYSIAEGPEVETDFYNFGALNFPDDHPARDAQDTFFTEGRKRLLRTHTSPVQIRTMQAVKPPLKLIAPGKVFRMDPPDATHYPIFHQIEGLVVDENVSLADLKGTLEHFARECFSADTRLRLRPSFFPFVEPGAEVDISCIFCGGKGCRICKQSGWIEILGAGMVHPNVFRASGVDPVRYTGFAFGMGVDRVAILKYGVPDIRLFWENDVRFLNQFRFLARS